MIDLLFRILALALVVAAAQPTFAAEKIKPNVLLILTDDQGYGDIRSHGNDKIATPVLDRLAASGARFERFYVSPLCAPTRASLLTGRYHLRTGVHGVTRTYETMRAGEVTLAEALKAGGYATGCFGKWHNGAHYPHHPNGQGFDEFIGFCAGHTNLYFDPVLEHNGKPLPTKGFITDVLTDRALAFMEKNAKQPFFCYVPYNAPHAPWQAPDNYFDRHKDRGLERTTACVHAMCENIDDNLGRLLKKLDDLKLADNTIVLFLTDNGPNTDRFNADMRGRKGSIHEGGVRVPLFVRWPGHIKPGTMVERIAAHLDLYPTLLDLCGVTPPKGPPLDGVSLVPLLRGSDKDWPDRKLFTHAYRKDPNGVKQGAVRTDRWRATFDGKKWELFDMKADPKQTTDVAAQHPDVMKELRAALEASFTDVMKDGFAPIPTEIGHEASPLVTLGAHEAFLHKAGNTGIRYHGQNGWANDWITAWTDAKAYPLWEIDVVRGGRYEIAFQYACAAKDVGSKVRVEAGDRTLETTLKEPHERKAVPMNDRVLRAEAPEQTWATWTLGVMDLPKGRTTLTIRAATIAGEGVLELKAVRIRRVE